MCLQVCFEHLTTLCGVKCIGSFKSYTRLSPCIISILRFSHKDTEEQRGCCVPKTHQEARKRSQHRASDVRARPELLWSALWARCVPAGGLRVRAVVCGRLASGNPVPLVYCISSVYQLMLMPLPGSTAPAPLVVASHQARWHRGAPWPDCAACAAAGRCFKPVTQVLSGLLCGTRGVIPLPLTAPCVSGRCLL